MKLYRCQPGQGQVTSVPSGAVGSSCAVWVSQASGDPGGWVLELVAEGPSGRYRVRRQRLGGRGQQGSAGGRIVMVETVPDARARWGLVVTAPSSAPLATKPLGVRVTASEVGAVANMTAPDGGVYNHATGTDGTESIPPGARVRAWSAVASAGADATVSIESPPVALPTITIAAGDAFEDREIRGLEGPIDFVFTNTARYWIAWVEA